MMSEAPLMNNEVYNHYLTGMTPAEFAEHLKDVCPEFGDLNIEELLLMQESAFQYIQNNNQNRDTTSSYGETSNSSLVLEHENEPSHEASVEHQLALDEALAIALELGDDFNNLNVHEDVVSAVDNARSTLRETPIRGESQNIRQDEIDPDRMTYEELQSPGESLGSKSKGLSADLISWLPTFRYRAGLFSKKKKKEKEEYTRSTLRETPIRAESQNIRQDEIDPDRMTYEELQALAESLGSQSRGLSADLFSRLPTFKYKAGLFSKKNKKEKEECVICCDGYKNGDTLTTLPCAHQYHSDCITPWLEHNKQCPICQKEVQDE